MPETVLQARQSATPATPAVPVAGPTRRPSRSRGLRGALPTWLVRHGGTVLAGAVLLLVITAAVTPHLLAPGDPLLSVPSHRLRPPGPQHWFGTDQLGRDLYTRIVYGAGRSLTATTLAVGIALGVGSVLGLLAGAVGGTVDTALMRTVDVLLSVPSLLLSLALVTALGFGTVNVAIAVGVSLVASFARVMRSEVLRVKHAPYIEAARASGVRPAGILARHILPNSVLPVLSLAAVEFGGAILAISALSFLGFGAAPPTPEWGSLIADGRNYLATAWWLSTLPGLVIVATVLAANVLARALAPEEHR